MAEHRLTDRPAGWLPPTRRLEKLISLGLLFALMLAAVVSLTDTFWGPDWPSLWRCVLLGLLLGWGLGILRQPAYRAILLTVVTGFLYVMLFPGGLSAQAGALLASYSHVFSSFVSSWGGALDARPLISAWQELFTSAGSVIGQVRDWFAALAQNPSAFDPLAVALVWDALIWLASAWAGWVIAVMKNALLAAFPALILSAGALSYSRHVSLVLYAALGATLMLLAAVQLDCRKQAWDELGVAYPRRKGRQIANAALAVTLGLVFLSAALSSISLQRVRDWVSEQSAGSSQSDQNGRAAPSQVTEPIANRSFLGGPGQQRDHLITAGPATSDHVVMTVSIGNLAAISPNGQLPPLYWRSATYDIYTGHGWSTSATQSISYQANQPIQADRASGSVPVEQGFFPVENLGGSVYAAGEPVTLGLPSEAAWRAPGDLFGLQIAASTAYTVYSLVPLEDVASLRSAGQNYPDWVRQEYMDLPSEVPARVKALAERLTASQPTVFDKAQAIESYLRTYPYTLDVPFPPKQQDVVDYFLFDLRKGYCDYYASAMVVLAREVGIPARLAIGYASGTYNLNSKRFVVTEADAHSWVEVYFPGIGWVPFEPTAASPQLQRLGQTAAGGVRTSNPAAGLTSNQPATSLPFNWLFLLGLIALAVVAAGTAWVIYGEVRFHRLPQTSAAVLIFRRLKRYGSHLAVVSDSGATPYEFAASLQMRLQELAGSRKQFSFIGSSSKRIRQLMDGIVWVCYCPSGPPAGRLQVQWTALRWSLSALWMLKIWNKIVATLRFRRAPAGIVPNDQG